VESSISYKNKSTNLIMSAITSSSSPLTNSNSNKLPISSTSSIDNMVDNVEDANSTSVPKVGVLQTHQSQVVVFFL